jgi:hypothetical protein
MIRTIIRLAVFALILNAAARVALAYVDFARFKDQLVQVARSLRDRPDDEIVDGVMDLGVSLEIPLDRNSVRVRREPNHTYIDVTYTEQLRLFPNATYPWTFNVTADGWVVTPVTADELLGRS